MVKTYSDGRNIYSVEMMFSYVNNFKVKTTLVPIKDILFNLEVKGWANSKGRYSPVEVLKNPKKYPEEIKKIKEANLKYPIMLDGNNIADGVHRTIKAIQQGKTTIKAYKFPKKLLKKFLLSSTGDWEKARGMQTWELIDLFYKRFVKK